MIKPILKQYNDTEWDFIYPIDDEYFDTFFYATDFLGENDEKCEKILRELIQKQPYFIDAYTYLGFALQNQGKEENGFLMLEKAYNLAMDYIPENFDFTKHQISWYNTDNRPFLRILDNFATEHYRKGNLDISTPIFEKLLMINPPDNQGVRYSLLEIYFQLENYNKVRELLKSYDDNSIDFNYGAVVLAVLENDVKKADELLGRAVESNKYFIEILKENCVIKEDFEEYAVGSKEEAYDYWKRNYRLYNNEKINHYFRGIDSNE